MLKILPETFPIVFSKVFTKKLVKKLFHGQTISSGFLLGVFMSFRFLVWNLVSMGLGLVLGFFGSILGMGCQTQIQIQTQRPKNPSTKTQRPKNPSTKPKPKEIKFQTQTQTPKNIWVQKKSEKTYSLKYFNINKIF